MDDIPEFPEEYMESSQLCYDEDKNLLAHTLPGLAAKREVSEESRKATIDVIRDNSVLCSAGYDSPHSNAQFTQNANDLRSEDNDCSILRNRSYQPLNDTLPNFKVGDLIWGKVKSHPWWPGQIFSDEDASAAAKRKQTHGRQLVAFFGDGTYGWLQPSQMVDFREHFKEKSTQTTMKSFCKAVSEALEEVCRRSEIGIACFCHNGYLYNTSTFPDANIGIRDMGLRIKTHNDISMSKTVLCPVKILEFVKTVACFPSCNFNSNLEMSEMRGQVFGIRSGLVSIMRKHEEKSVLMLKRKSSDIDENCIEQEARGAVHKKLVNQVSVSVVKAPLKRSPEFDRASGVKKPKKNKTVFAEDIRDDGSETLLQIGCLNSKLLKKIKNRKILKRELGSGILEQHEENQSPNSAQYPVNTESDLEGNICFPQSIYTQFAEQEQNSLHKSDSAMVFEHLQTLKLVARDALIKAYIPHKVSLAMMSLMKYRDIVYQKSPGYGSSVLNAAEQKVLKKLKRSSQTLSSSSRNDMQNKESSNMEVSEGNKNTTILHEFSNSQSDETFQTFDTEKTNEGVQIKCKQQLAQSLEAKASSSNSATIDYKCKIEETLEENEDAHIAQSWDRERNYEIESAQTNDPKGLIISTDKESETSGFKKMRSVSEDTMESKYTLGNETVQLTYESSQIDDTISTDKQPEISEFKNMPSVLADAKESNYKLERKNVQLKHKSSQIDYTKGITISTDNQPEASKFKTMPSVSAGAKESKCKFEDGNVQLKFKPSQIGDTNSPVIAQGKQKEPCKLNNKPCGSAAEMKRKYNQHNKHVELSPDSQLTSSAKEVNKLSGNIRKEMKCQSEHKHAHACKRDVQKNKLHGAGMDKIDPVNPARNALLSDCYLFMKFPEDMCLPSESHLKSIFVKFGPIRTSSIKVFNDKLMARVGFKHPKDARTALNFAKQKYLFGQRSVVFWLKTYQNRQKPEPSDPECKPPVSTDRSTQQVPERNRNVDRASAKATYMAEVPSNVDMNVMTSSRAGVEKSSQRHINVPVSIDRSTQQMPESHRNVDRASSKATYMAELPSDVKTAIHAGVEKSTQRHIKVHTVSSKTNHLSKVPPDVPIKPCIPDKRASLVNVNEPKERVHGFTTPSVVESCNDMPGEIATRPSYVSESDKGECLPLAHLKINHSVTLCISERGTKSCNAKISSPANETVIASGLLASETNDGSVKISSGAKTANCNYISLSLQESPVSQVSHVNQPSVDIEDKMLNLLHQLSFMMNSYYHHSVIQ